MEKIKCKSVEDTALYTRVATHVLNKSRCDYQFVLPNDHTYIRSYSSVYSAIRHARRYGIKKIFVQWHDIWYHVYY